MDKTHKTPDVGHVLLYERSRFLGTPSLTTCLKGTGTFVDAQNGQFSVFLGVYDFEPFPFHDNYDRGPSLKLMH